MHDEFFVYFQLGLFYQKLFGKCFYVYISENSQSKFFYFNSTIQQIFILCVTYTCFYWGGGGLFENQKKCEKP